ncbi:hypothetical protein [Motiliproteus sp. MSK22-1]|nr:hypothetical protein [Motiliproteus sp. MSK22-1]
MKQGPDLIMMLIVVFAVGFVITTLSQSDLQFASVVTQVFSQATNS